MIWLSVAIGGALGACLRYALYISVPTLAGLPVGTFVANALGSFLMGALAAWLRAEDAWESPLRLVLMVGVLGALTTFSTFALEAVDALRAGRVSLAMAYVVVTVLVTVTGCWIGYILGQSLGR